MSRSHDSKAGSGTLSDKGLDANAIFDKVGSGKVKMYTVLTPIFLRLKIERPNSYEYRCQRH